jgi:hypothetical protein
MVASRGHLLLLRAVLDRVVMDSSGMVGRGRWLVNVESAARGRPGRLLGGVAVASGCGAGSGARWELARGRPWRLFGDVASASGWGAGVVGFLTALTMGRQRVWLREPTGQPLGLVLLMWVAGSGELGPHGGGGFGWWMVDWMIRS